MWLTPDDGRRESLAKCVRHVSSEGYTAVFDNMNRKVTDDGYDAI
jgi:hypothetical protein